MIRFFAHFLFLLAAWTLTIKYVFPAAFALAVGVLVVKIIIVVTKFVLFLGEPDWTIWTTNWFINKVFVLACFILILGYFALKRRSLPRETTLATENP